MFKWLKRLLWLILLLSSIGIAAVAALYFHLEKGLPDVSSLKDTNWETPLRVYSADGELMSEFGDVKRIPLRLDQIPLRMQQAFLAIEDSRFYEHPGIDFIGIARAGLIWAVSGQMRQGASTITQQVARNFFLSREKTLSRKIKEVFLAWRIEQELTKGEILELYLNKIPLGYRAYGVGAAAQVYYGKTVDQLTLGEMAVIAGLPKAPSMLNPIRSPQRALARRNLVLSRMLQLGMIKDDEYQAAIKEPIVTHYHGTDVGLDAPYLAEMVRKFMLDTYGEESYSKGYQVYTTISSVQQKAAHNAVFKGLLDYDIRHGYRGVEKHLWTKGAAAWNSEQINNYLSDLPSYEPFEPAIVTAVNNKDVTVVIKGGLDASISWDGLKWARPFISDERQGTAPRKAADILSTGDLIWVWQDEGSDQLRLAQIPDANAAFVALNPKNGAIQALVGGFNFEISKFNRVEQARRQVGSNIKPFIYSSALANGFTLASIIDDAPITQWDGGTSGWSPKNSPPQYDGPITLREALARSKNVVTVRLLRGVGIDKVLDHLRLFGFPDSSLQRNESISLGTAEFTPLELVTGYATFANGGFKVTPYFIDRIEDASGHVVYEATPKMACAGCGKLAETGLDSVAAYKDELGDWHSQCPIDPVTPNQQAPRIISSANAFLISEALHSAIYGGADRGLGHWMGTGWRAAKELKRNDLHGKTGTTNEAKDAWFSGFTPNIVATAWVGFDDHRRALGRSISGNEFGASAAQPIWIEYMKTALNGIPDRIGTTPDDVVSMRVNNYSGLATNGTAGSREEFFEKGTEPASSNQQESVLFDDGNTKLPTQPQSQEPSVVSPAPVSAAGKTGTDDIF
ncbi:penicillin-binding protein 1A [Tolumonas lignilytica]|uniref:penicillin-binding protein 1A n=1 Tax=Tolumonas lignilytica TaxID=1283284 RepID=UPI0004650CF9|nr:PBP1A family penicillin-binding protein [Tolumonas lignilytica]